MSDILFISIVINFAFAALVIYFSFKDERKKIQLKNQQRQLSRTMYEVSILNQITEKVESAKDIPSLAQTISLTIEQLLEVTTVTYATIENGEIAARTYTEEPVGEKYIESINEAIKASMAALQPNTNLMRFKNELMPNDIKNNIAKSIDTVAGSLFHIPLVFHNKYYGVITVGHRKKAKYEKADLDILYKMVRQIERSVEKLEEVITSEKGKLDALVVSLPSGAILLTLESGYLKLSTMNHAAREFLKLDETADAGQVIASLGSSHDFVKDIKDVMREKKSMVLNEVEIHGRFFKIFLNPVFSYSAESIIGVNVTLQDVTREKEIDKIKETFTSMIVHELRAPLVSIKGASQLLISGHLPEEEQTKMLQTIKVSVDRMLSQVSDLLDSAKLEAGKFDIVPKVSSLNNVIRDRLAILSYDAQNRKVTIVPHLDQDLPEFKFDPERIGQVVNNLVYNSLKFTKEGGQITVESRQHGDSAEVSITDTGVGIPEDKKALLFSKYGQLESIAKSKGTGLGLYISKGIVEAHGGTIRLQSEVGRGTTVTFTLPLHETLQTKLSATSSIPQPDEHHAMMVN